jgi:hypothetical protein
MPSPSRSAATFMDELVFDDPNYDLMSFNFDSDVETVDKKAAAILNPSNPDRTRNSASGDRSDEICRQRQVERRRFHASALPLSPARRLQRLGQRQRRGEFRMPEPSPTSLKWLNLHLP